MKTVSSTEFRRNASKLFSEVENGEVIVVMRHGKPIAEVRPAASKTDHIPSWKRPGLRLPIKGVSLSATIIEERESADSF